MLLLPHTVKPLGVTPAEPGVYLNELESGGFFNAERGMMFVPANRSDPASAVIAVEVYRFKASSKATPGTPPIFFLHGGPSFGGLESSLAELGTFEERWQPFLDVSDLVVVSQRGVGPSKPTTTIDTTTPPAPVDQPYDDKKAVAELQKVLKRAKDFWTGQGLDLKGFTVVEAAADVDDVRKALGYQKIIIWGGSFGSHWGMTLMRAKPEIVERAILYGMEGPDHTYDHPGHLWKVYERVAAKAEKAPELKSYIPEGGLIQALEKVIAKAEKEPFTVKAGSQEVLFDGDSVKRLATGFSRGLPAWPADVIQLSKGDFSAAAEGVARRATSNRRSTTTASYYILDCSSGITAKRLVEYDSDPALKFLGQMDWGYTAGCPVWDSDLGDEFRQNFETEIPTVIVHGTWDTFTPFENATELVPYFKNGKFIAVNRGPHGAIRAAMRVSEPFRKGIMKFAATGDMSELPDSVDMPPVEWVIPGQPRQPRRGGS